MKVCTQCVLPETLPSMKLDNLGVCNYCRNFKGVEHLDQQRDDYKDKFEALLSSHASHNPGSYDIIVAYSGGKDSSFTLDVLRNQYGLRVLAVTFDHGFVSPFAIENIRRVVETLGIDHIMFKPDFQLMKQVFRHSLEDEFHPPKALERASSICNSCMGMVKFVTLRLAIEKDIPIIGYGWSPGQAPLQSAILKNIPAFIVKAQQLFLGPLEKAVGPAIRAYFLEDKHFANGAQKEFPYNVNILAFLRYDEEQIYERIKKLGWEPPRDTDPNSTNCLLNAFANEAHLMKHGYHPYAMELAELVREGVLPREEALNRLSKSSNPVVVDDIKKRLEM
jgi:tRNA(Ile)-lysidine synthase TilS/MesJ